MTPASPIRLTSTESTCVRGTTLRISLTSLIWPPMLTPTVIVTRLVGVTLGGQIKEVKEILSVVPLAQVDSVQVKRMGLGGVLVISAGGHSFKLEGKVGDMREFADAFGRAKATAS